MTNITAQTDITAHYDEAYFKFQIEIANLGSRCFLDLFQNEIEPSDTVLDFGCGAGTRLSLLLCNRRIGIDINQLCRETAGIQGIEAYPNIQHVPKSSIDVVISNHALEHVAEPLSTLVDLQKVLRPGGKLVLVVPCESYRTKWKPENIDRHLYTWAPVNIGNLVRAAGFTVLSCRRLAHRMPPKSRFIYRLTGWAVYNQLCRLWALLAPGLTQIAVVARKQ